MEVSGEKGKADGLPNSNDGSSSHGGDTAGIEQDTGENNVKRDESTLKQEGGGGEKITLGTGLNPLEFLDDNQLGSMDDDQVRKANAASFGTTRAIFIALGNSLPSPPLAA